MPALRTKVHQRKENSHGRTPEQLIGELQNRLHHFYALINGDGYDLPFNDPGLFDFLCMIINYPLADSHKSDLEIYQQTQQIAQVVMNHMGYEIETENIAHDHKSPRVSGAFQCAAMIQERVSGHAMDDVIDEVECARGSQADPVSDMRNALAFYDKCQADGNAVATGAFKDADEWILRAARKLVNS